MKITALITAAGKGQRTGLDFNKLLYKINNTTIIEQTVAKFVESDLIDNIVITAAKNDIDTIKSLFNAARKPVLVTEGGKTRTISVKNGLKAICDCDIVLIHDGARPFVSQSVISRCIENVKRYKSAVTAIPMTDTLKKADSNMQINCSVDRAGLYAIQTPQGFFYKDIMDAYMKINENESFTDDSSVYQKYIKPPYISLGEITNTKITYFDDLKNRSKQELRCGTGYDSHRLEKNRKLIIGGVLIPFEKGLAGHSDADVLVHAIIDSIFSAAGLADIGSHFPDTDKQFKDADSIKLLEKCNEIIYDEGFTVSNLSAVINCQSPKLAPYILLMKKNISKALDLKVENIGIAAKTNEGMGFTGRGEGIFVIANCIIKSKI